MIGKWLQFSKERFEPVSHLLMIGLFFLAHYVVVNASLANLSLGDAALFIGVTAFFFKLRLFDEIKDYETDLRVNPSRPLARGLVTHSDLFRGIAVCTVIEFLGFAGAPHTGLIPILSWATTTLYSFLMYREFFISEFLRPKLTTYAVTHTFVSALLSLSLLITLSGTHTWKVPMEFLAFALSSWGLFNVFEFGRKTFASSEERPTVPSYSKVFGRAGAVTLVVAMGVGVSRLVSQSTLQNIPLGQAIQSGITLTLGIFGTLYALTNQSRFGKLYRVVSSVYIILIYLNVVLSHEVFNVSH